MCALPSVALAFLKSRSTLHLELPYYILQFKIHFILLQPIAFNEKLLMSQEVAVYSCVVEITAKD